MIFYDLTKKKKKHLKHYYYFLHLSSERENLSFVVLLQHFHARLMHTLSIFLFLFKIEN